MEAGQDGVFLVRYTDGGEFAGDTWTPTRDLALGVASEEYGLREKDWIEVPEGVSDAIGFARHFGGGRRH
jgi:hypothetical protein